MKLLGALAALVLLALPSTLPLAAQTSSAANLAGDWIATGDLYGSTMYFRMKLTQDGAKVTGTVRGRQMEGTLHGASVHLAALKDEEGRRMEADVKLDGAKLSGKVSDKSISDEERSIDYSFTAERVPARSTAPPKRHEFTPTVFRRQFSPFYPPVLTVAPGDTIHTWTVDAGGADAQGVRRVRGGNPQTGPFYVETAMPGDTLVVHINRLKLNRDYAGSDDSIVESGLNSDLAVLMKDVGKGIRWDLDVARGVAFPHDKSGHLANFTVPLKPMLGCVATAEPPAAAPSGTGDSGSFGGNMDFNEVGEGATLYLPVYNPGALLYFGDAHAAQGDGEINGNALETSMDVEVTVDVIPGKHVGGPRVVTPTHIVSMGLEGSLDQAIRSATSEMAHWLQEDYALTPSEIGQVIGAAAEYKVGEIADRNSTIVLKLSKERLAGLPPVKK